MLKANELRIGNIIQLPPMSIPRLNISSNGYMAVTGYGISVLESDTNNNLVWSGISLTEEILLKCGFKHPSFYVIGAGSSLKWQLGDFILLKDFSGKFYLPTMPKNIVFDYLHQLQNVYYYINNYKEINTSGLI